MARYTGPKTRIARKFGDAIYGPDKSFERKKNPPGQHGANRRRKTSEYGIQLKEKQKAKYTYGVLERQFANLFDKASRSKGITGEVLLQLLESRLDNVVFRLGLAPTRRAARQLVSHKHIMVNGDLVNIPSYILKAGDIVTVRERSKSLETIAAALSGFNHTKYSWLEWEEDIVGGKFLNTPLREDIPENIKEQLIVELYSKKLEIKSMGVIPFQQPDKVIMIESDDRIGKFEFRPLEPGYGITIGNSLRRILLSSLEGHAITYVKIEGVDHEFSTIKGVIEDVTEIVLNLKQVRFRKRIEDNDQERVTVTVTGKETFTAGDIGNFLTGFEVLNPDLVICSMEKTVKLQLDINIEKGRGYRPADENKVNTGEQGIIPVSSIFTPIKLVKYDIENIRVEQKTDYEKLVIDIETDGSIHPKDALKEAARILMLHFMLFSDEKISLESASTNDNEEFDEEVLHMRQQLKTKLVDMDLSVRALNCLKAADVETLGELVVFNKNDLLKFRNFGKKSLTELDELLERLSLNFGMDISKYKLDKE